MKNAEWTPAMVERASRKIRKIESGMSLSAFLISSVTGIVTFFGFILFTTLLASGVLASPEDTGPGLMDTSAFYLQLRTLVKIMGTFGAFVFGIMIYFETNKMIRKAISGSVNHKELTVPGRGREWMKKAGELLSFLERIETKKRLLSSLLAKEGKIKDEKFCPVKGMDDDEKYSLMCDIYDLDYLLSLEKEETHGNKKN